MTQIGVVRSKLLLGRGNMAQPHEIKKVVCDTKFFTKAAIYKLVAEYTNSQSLQQIQFNRVLDKILPLFKSKKLIDRLDLNEIGAYEQFIKPLIDGKKRLPFATGIFFSSLISLAMPNLQENEFMGNLIRKKSASDLWADDWINRIDGLGSEYVSLFIKNEYKEYMDAKEAEQKKARNFSNIANRNKKLAEINEKYCENLTSYAEKWHEKKYAQVRGANF